MKEYIVTEAVVNRVVNYIREYRKVCNSEVRIRGNRGYSVWELPGDGTVKVNFDTAVEGVWLAWDNKGEVIVFMVKIF